MYQAPPRKKNLRVRGTRLARDYTSTMAEGDVSAVENFPLGIYVEGTGTKVEDAVREWDENRPVVQY